MAIFKLPSNIIQDNAITSAKIANSAVTLDKLDPNVVSSISQSGGGAPKVSNIIYSQDLAASVDGGTTVTLLGTSFQNGAVIYIGSVVAPTVSYTNTTQLSFTTPALSSGDYLLYVINPDGSTGIAVPGLSVSGIPSWNTSAGALTSTTESTYSNVTLNAESDSNVTYSITSGNLPPGLILNANTGVISGVILSNVANLSTNTTFNFSVDAEDEELQNTTRAFSITYIPTFPTWYSPNAGSLSSATLGELYTANLNAISNSGVVYSIPSGNLTGNISISGSSLTGTPPESNTYYFTIRATDAEGHYTDREFSLNVEVSTDTHFKNTTLLLTGDATNGAQNNTFLDSSANNFTITRNGNATQGSFSPFSQTGWSNHFDGSGDYLTYTYGSEVAFGTGDFTVEWWQYSTDTSSGILQGDSGAGWGATILSGTFYWQSVVNVTNKLSASVSAYLTDSWNHWAVVRSSGTLRLYINGAQIASVSDTTNYSDSSGTMNIGYYPANGNYILGYLSNLRIVKGTAVYTSAFTPSTAPLTAISGTSLLTCQSNRFVDNSASPKTITVNGNTSVQAFSPFAPNTITPVSYGAYLDGTDDRLQVNYSTSLTIS